jgi:KDO2-lipid IV(A) lauroyltransferase
LNVSNLPRDAADAADAAQPPARDGIVPRRWTLHGLNNGPVFHATYHGARTLPRAVSYTIGTIATWLAWRLMRTCRAAIADNLRAIFPHETERQLQRRALATLRAYAYDSIDFLRAIDASRDDARALFEHSRENHALFERLLAEGRGIIVVTGHCGNWEMGSLLMRYTVAARLTIIAMAEANPSVNRIRNEIRDRLGAETLEVRHELDTALQIRRRLGNNQMVAMLMDRHLGRDRVGVTLLGRHAWFLRTPAVLSYLTGAPLLPCFINRSAPSRFTVHLGTPIRVARDANRDEAIQQATQQFADQLGEQLRKYPEHWYHFYRYWDAQRDAYEGLE